MARKPRTVVVDVAHHVVMRGNNRRRLFSSNADRLRFIRCLVHGVRLSRCVLHQLTLMNNHVHLIAVPLTKGALSCLVARTCQPYAQLRNAARDGSGKLFEERFYSHVIEDDAAMMTITMYNDANAYRAGLAESPFAHAWSTGPLHASVDGSRIPEWLWTPSRWYRALGKEPESRGQAYRSLIRSYAEREEPVLPEGHGPIDDVGEAYTRRLERPDGTVASEGSLQWRQKAERRR